MKIQKKIIQNDKNKKTNTEKILPEIISEEPRMVEPSFQYHDLSKNMKYQRKINQFSRDLTKDLEKVHEITTEEAEEKQRNKDVLKIMTQSVTRIEQVAKTNEKHIDELRKHTKDNEDYIRGLQEEIEQLKAQIKSKPQLPAGGNNAHHPIPYPTIPYQQTNDYTQQQDKQRNPKPPIQPVGISPGEGQLADPTEIPAISYAWVLGRRKKPRVEIPEETYQMIPELKDSPTTENSDKEHYTEETMDLIKKELHKSALIIGIKPITNKTVDLEEEKNPHRRSEFLPHGRTPKNHRHQKCRI